MDVHVWYEVNDAKKYGDGRFDIEHINITNEEIKQIFQQDEVIKIKMMGLTFKKTCRGHWEVK